MFLTIYEILHLIKRFLLYSKGLPEARLLRLLLALFSHLNACRYYLIGVALHAYAVAETGLAKLFGLLGCSGFENDRRILCSGIHQPLNRDVQGGSRTGCTCVHEICMYINLVI